MPCPGKPEALSPPTSAAVSILLQWLYVPFVVEQAIRPVHLFGLTVMGTDASVDHRLGQGGLMRVDAATAPSDELLHQPR